MLSNSYQKQDAKHKAVTQQLVRRYVISEKRREPGGLTKRGVRQLRHDISALRCELIDVLPHQNPYLVPDLISFKDMNTADVSPTSSTHTS